MKLFTASIAVRQRCHPKCQPFQTCSGRKLNVQAEKNAIGVNVVAPAWGFLLPLSKGLAFITIIT